MDVASWQKRIEDTFNEGGVIGPHLLPIISAEEWYNSYIISTFRGYNVIIDSFLSFYIETLRSAETCARQKHSAPNQWYAPLLLFHCAMFRTFRATENLLRCGYPFAGYALLRDLKDRTIILGAIANGLTTYEKVNGLDFFTNRSKPLTEEDMRELKNIRKREEGRVFDQMLRSKSGFGQEHKKELTRWEEMFHLEVHGSRLTTAMDTKRWIKGEVPLSLHPSPDERTEAMYLNRSNEVAWMLLRTFPFLQLKPQGFNVDWAQKWIVLDESFRYMIEGLGKIGKKIASSIIRLVDTKFDFRPERTYYKE